MSVKPARPAEGRVIDLQARRTARIHALLALREQFGAAYAAYEAHGHEMLALQMWQQIASVESEIRQMAPSVHARRWADWIERDAELMHGPGERRAGCVICNLNHAAGLPVAG